MVKMGREKKGKKRKSGSGAAKERHGKGRRGNVLDWKAPLPPGLVARPDKPRISSKHKSWFEFVENKDKKKKLEIQVIESREPPPGFEFVPIGNPALTTLCKELSRERCAMIFIVTSSNGVFSQQLSLHLNRIGHHIRESIVDEARRTLGDNQRVGDAALLGLPEPIPERQEDIDAQADAAIRDLFPRIPNTDRQMIIEHAFNKSKVVNPESPPVGLAAHLTLSRRVQLAVLAHIRHNHTRYDQLLRETSYVNARKAVESLCLDYLVKWRGDEETGRDQLDEILCEVIVISDSETSDSDSDDDESEDDSDEDTDSEDESSDTTPVEEGSRAELGTVNVSTRPLLPDLSWSDEDMRGGTSRVGVPGGSLLPGSPRGDASTRDGGQGRTGALSRPLPAPVTHSSHPQDTNRHHEDVSPRAVKHRIRKNERRDREKKEAKWAKRNFGRYQAVWDQAVERQRLEQGGSAQVSAATGRSASRAPQSWLSGHSERPEQTLRMMTGSPRQPPHHARHQSFGPPLHQAADYHVHGNGAGPIVGSQYHADREAEQPVQRSYRSEDQPLQSIEPSSPSGHHVRRRPTDPIGGGATDPMRVVAYRAVVPTDRAMEPQDYHNYGDDEGFIRLGPRSDQRRVSIHGPTSRAAPHSPIETHHHGTSRTYSPSAYNANQGRQDGRPLPRTEARPIWIDEDGLVLRSAARPIHIPDHRPADGYSPRQQALPPVQFQEPQRLSIRVANSRTQQIDSGPGAFHETAYVDRSNDRVIMDRLPDGVELVRVTNKFPKQYGSDPKPVDQRRNQLYDSPPLHVTQHVPSHPPRYERVVARYEQPVLFPANVVAERRQPEGRMVTPQRQERVVAYEVVRTHSGHENIPYTDQHGRVIQQERYPSHMGSVPPGGYYDTNPPGLHRRLDSRGREIIVLDD